MTQAVAQGIELPLTVDTDWPGSRMTVGPFLYVCLIASLSGAFAGKRLNLQCRCRNVGLLARN
ncbi:hypothetical protein BZM27_08715 [Paraburkholderia steynii]|uniref:Uncharacterized protein n=1 Tax=Paraburkholderia steynii TaxID=1245441 RepID=A0A4R0XLB4_9BURK|nr:hypothetical protein BZM27_08715 [Paraburkholderia steynii]